MTFAQSISKALMNTKLVSKRNFLEQALFVANPVMLPKLIAGDDYHVQLQPVVHHHPMGRLAGALIHSTIRWTFHLHKITGV